MTLSKPPTPALGISVSPGLRSRWAGGETLNEIMAT